MSHNDLLRIQNLKVCAGEKEILHGIDLDIHENEVHVLMGPNGTGKSTLGAALMGNPAYTVTGGDIIYKGQNINEMPDNERAKNGIFLSFQNPIEIPASPSVRLSAVHWKPRPASVSVCSASKRNWKKKWHCSRWIRPMQREI